jgi:type I restriction enzyme M protein
MPRASDFARLVKEIRTRLDLTQEELARRLKTSLPSVSRWETKRARPDARARHLMEELLRNQGEPLADLLAEFFPGSKPRARARAAIAPTPSGLETKSMETMLWRAACMIRGEKDAPKFKDYILPLIFVKRLSDVFEDELTRLAELYGGEEQARTVIEADPSVVRFFIPPEASWAVLSGRQRFEWPEDRRPKTLGEQLTSTVRLLARLNPSLQGVIDIVDYNEVRNGEREISDDALSKLIETLSDRRYRLGLGDVEPDFLGRAYEYLLRKFAEGQGQSAGEFFTPKEVGWLIAHLVEPRQGESVYDPCCGSGGLLVKCELALAQREKPLERPLRLFGQELTGSSFAIARMNMVIHDMQGEIVRGNTMTNPKFLADGSTLQTFDVVVTNPMWNQSNFELRTYEDDPFERFAPRGGFASNSSADWAWLQHVLASLAPGGRAAIVLDTGAVSRGSGNQGENREKSIRRWFVEQDLVEGVVLLPDNLFYNTTAAGVIVLLRRDKPTERRDRVVLVNASGEFEKGRPKNFIPDASVQKIADAFHAAKDVSRLVRVATREEIAAKDYNLSPSAYVEIAAPAEHRDIQEILNDLAKLDGEARELDGQLEKIFAGLGYRWGGVS